MKSFDITIALAIAVAGGLGSVVRLVLARWIGKLPWGILVANVLASFAMGVGLGIFSFNTTLAQIVSVGLCGGLSTFSTFSAQTVEYFKAKQVWRGVFNILLNFFAPSLAALAGIFLLLTLLK
jgi:fluoride exporter